MTDNETRDQGEAPKQPPRVVYEISWFTRIFVLIGLTVGTAAFVKLIIAQFSN